MREKELETFSTAASSSSPLFLAAQDSPESAQPKKRPRILSRYTSAEAVEEFINEDN